VLGLRDGERCYLLTTERDGESPKIKKGWLVLFQKFQTTVLVESSVL
jgi:hypothetical protein